MLVVSIMVLSIIVVIALSASLVSIREQKSVAGEANSSKAFQAADSGIEFVMNEIVNGNRTFVKQLSHCQVSDGVIHNSNYDVQLYNSSGAKIDCTSQTEPIYNITQLKSTGTDLGQSRAIEAAVPRSGCGEVVNYGGQDYDTVQIGTQCWFRQNLNVGNMLPNVTTTPDNTAPTLNSPNTVSKWCYGDSVANCNTNKYGGLYTWAEANGLPNSCSQFYTSCAVSAPNQGICPAGWHIPSDTELFTLENFLKTGATCDPNRSSYTLDCIGADTNMKIVSASDFSLLNGGMNFSFSSSYFGINSYATLQSSTEHNSGGMFTSYARWMIDGYNGVYRMEDSKADGFSVRCIKT